MIWCWILSNAYFCIYWTIDVALLLQYVKWIFFQIFCDLPLSSCSQSTHLWHHNFTLFWINFYNIFENILITDLIPLLNIKDFPGGSDGKAF